MRVLCVTQDFPPNPGGIAVFLHNLCVQLCDLGHKVDVLTPISNGCASDVFVMPSYDDKDTGRSEIFYISYSEANTCGNPDVP